MKFRPEHFRKALEEARRLVKTLPPAEVPHTLRRTRGSSSRRMTPVEARTLYRALDGNEDLRQATLSSWDPPSLAEADQRTAASVLFLKRSHRWESAARGILAEIALEKAEGEIEQLKTQERKARAKVASLKEQIEQVRQGAAKEIENRTADSRQDLARARDRIVKLENELAEKGKDARYWETEANAAFNEITLADRRYDDLRDRYRTKKVPAASQDPTNISDIGFSRDPLETARMLDHMTSFWEVGSDSPSPATSHDVTWQLPPGIDPRSGTAVSWLYHDAARSRLVVDGWNVAHYWHYRQGLPVPPERDTVERITNKLAKLAKYSIGEHRVSFYLDSREVNGIDLEWENRFQDGYLTGYYVEDADDAIAEEASRRTGEAVVVITSDKELADRCRVHGAVVLASESLAEWMAESPV